MSKSMVISACFAVCMMLPTTSSAQDYSNIWNAAKRMKLGLDPPPGPDGTLFLGTVIDWSKRDARPFVTLISREGKIQQQITADSVTSSSGLWSPDQNHLVFTSWSGVRHELFISNADGSNKQTIPTSSNIFNYAVAWSSDNDRIIINSTDGQTSDKIIWKILIKHISSEILNDETPFKDITISSYATSWRRR